jgi:hypothetical protein
MNLTGYSNRQATISNFKIELFPNFIVCPDTITGTEPYTFTSSVISTGITFNDTMTVYRSFCRPGGLNYNIGQTTANLYVNGILRQTNTGGGEGVSLGCPSVLTKAIGLSAYPINYGDNVLIEWIDS